MEENEKRSALVSFAHDINNLMTGLVGMLEILAKANASRVQGFTIQEANSCAQSIVRLSRSVMAYYVGEAKGQAPKQEPFSLQEIFDDLETVFRPKAKTNQVELSFKLTMPTPGYVVSDHAMVSLILFNLLHNAVKYTEEGCICVEAVVDETTCCLTVSDTGVGVPPDKSATIFRILQQGHEDSEQRGGIGIGLSLCKSLTEALNGEIKLQRLDQGSCFIVTFPIRHQVLLPQPQTKLARVEPITFLMVDDSELQRMLVREAAKECGCTMFEASNGDEALSLLQKSRIPTFILMDGNMPGLSGPEVVSKIRDDPTITSDIPIYALSGMDTESQMVEFTGVEVAGYLEKPLRKEELLNLVRRHSARHA